MSEANEYLTGGMFVDIAIIVLLIEAVGLSAWYLWRGQGVAPKDLLPNLGAGFCLMLAVRAAIHNEPLSRIALWLGASGAAHAIDLSRRWRR